MVAVEEDERDHRTGESDPVLDGCGLLVLTSGVLNAWWILSTVVAFLHMSESERRSEATPRDEGSSAWGSQRHYSSVDVVGGRSPFRIVRNGL